MQQKNKEPGFSTEQYSKSKTQQLLGSVLELKKQFLGLNTKPWDLDISANNLAKQDIFLPNRQIGSQIFCQPCEESQKQECPLAAWNAESERPWSAGGRPPVSTWMDASQHPSGIRSAAFFSYFFPKAYQTLRMGITHRQNDHTARTAFKARGLLHCFCVKYLRLWITKGNLLKDQNRKQKEPVLELLTNPRTS